MLYNKLFSLAQDSSFLMQNFRQLVSDLNAPIVWLFWGILALVVLDVVHQLSGDSSKYGFMVGKVMIEAFFYSLFFAIWSDFFQKQNLRSNINLINNARRLLNLKEYVSRPKFIITVYFMLNNCLVIWYTSVYMCISYCAFSCIIFVKLSSLIVPYTMSNSQMYVNNPSNNKNVDAIIKWEYSKAPQPTAQTNWVILS